MLCLTNYCFIVDELSQQNEHNIAEGNVGTKLHVSVIKPSAVLPSLDSHENLNKASILLNQ